MTTFMKTRPLVRPLPNKSIILRRERLFTSGKLSAPREFGDLFIYYTLSLFMKLQSALIYSIRSNIMLVNVKG